MEEQRVVETVELVARVEVEAAEDEMVAVVLAEAVLQPEWFCLFLFLLVRRGNAFVLL